jgi:hypothetical protein
MTSKSPLRGVAVDATVLVGLGLLTYGAWLVYQPAAFIVSGSVLLGMGLTAAVRR